SSTRIFSGALAGSGPPHEVTKRAIPARRKAEVQWMGEVARQRRAALGRRGSVWRMCGSNVSETPEYTEPARAVQPVGSASRASFRISARFDGYRCRRHRVEPIDGIRHAVCHPGKMMHGSPGVIADAVDPTHRT